MLSRTHKFFLLVAGAAMAVPLSAQQSAPAAGNDDADLLALLNTPVQGASKRLQRAIESPQAVEVITPEQIRSSGVFRLTDLLKLATSVQVWEKDPARINVTIRGTNTNDNPRTVQLLLDGVPLFNFGASPVDWNALPVPIDAIERVEIVRGPSSSLYGANAQMGVIAVTTKQAKPGFAGSLRAAAAENGTFRQQGFVAYKAGDFSFTAALAGGSNRDAGQETPVLSKTVLIATPDAAREFQSFLRPELALGDQGKLWLAWGRGDGGHFDEQGVHAGLLVPIFTLTDQHIVRDIFQAGWSQAWSPTLKTEVKLDQKTFDWHVGPLTAIPGSALSTAVRNLMIGVDPGMATGYPFFHETMKEVTAQVNWEAAKNLHLVFGADSKRVDITGNPTTGMPTIEATATGGFVSADWEVGPVILSAGLRAANETLGGSSTSPRATVVYKLDEDSVLRAAYLTSKRSPMVQEKYTDVNSPALAAVVIPNPGIKPEDVKTLELGYRKAWTRFSLDVTLFRATLDGLITTYLTGANVAGKPVQQYQNNPKAFDNTGLELSLTGDLGNGLQTGLNASTCSFKDPIYNTDQQADFSPKALASLWLRYRHGMFFGYAALQHTGSYTAALTLTTVVRQEIPAANTLHFNVGLEPIPGFTVSAYGVNGPKATYSSSTTSLANGMLLRNARRELGVQAAFRF